MSREDFWLLAAFRLSDGVIGNLRLRRSLAKSQKAIGGVGDDVRNRVKSTFRFPLSALCTLP
jgi:hypothetical protein